MAEQSLGWRVALVVIARDEAARIRRLLDSIRPWVDEMLVLDTGSVDDTPQAAGLSGARVKHFDWCDDFSAARNAALDAVQADWHVVLDADEWLIDGGPMLRRLRHTRPAFVGSVALESLLDATSQAPAGVARVQLSRVLPGAVRYAGRVHEQPVHRLPVRPLPLRVGHDGYSGQRLADKRGRNRRLLQAELAQAPDDAYWLYQLGKDHDVYGEHAQALQAFEAAQARAPAGCPWRLDMVTRQLFNLKKLGLHPQAMAVAEQHLSACGQAPDFHFALGDVLLDWAAEQPALAPRLLPLAADAWQRCLAIGERPDLSGTVAGRGSYLAAHNLAVICEGLGRAAEARQLRKRHPMPAQRLPTPKTLSQKADAASLKSAARLAETPSIRRPAHSAPADCTAVASIDLQGTDHGTAGQTEDRVPTGHRVWRPDRPAVADGGPGLGRAATVRDGFRGSGGRQVPRDPAGGGTV